MSHALRFRLIRRSPSSRRAWIEIRKAGRRNPRHAVALLAEGVDRNPTIKPPPLNFSVALLAEGVDRNLFKGKFDQEKNRSPSSRRAWIEIFSSTSASSFFSVALLAEGVDRNWKDFTAAATSAGRPPRGGRG